MQTEEEKIIKVEDTSGKHLLTKKKENRCVLLTKNSYPNIAAWYQLGGGIILFVDGYPDPRLGKLEKRSIGVAFEGEIPSFIDETCPDSVVREWEELRKNEIIVESLYGLETELVEEGCRKVLLYKGCPDRLENKFYIGAITLEVDQLKHVQIEIEGTPTKALTSYYKEILAEKLQ